MSKVTTIQVEKKVLSGLKSAKRYPRQTYSELLTEMTRVFKAAKLRNQYDEFLHKIQQEKMAELWDNEADKEWENV